MTRLSARTVGAAIAALLAIIAALGVLVTSTSSIPRWDTDVVRWIAEHRSTAVVDVARVTTLFGHFAWTLGAMLLIGTVLAWKRVRGAWLPAIALIVIGMLGPLVKDLFGRPRPPVDLWAVTEHGTGFPSGHSGQAAAAWLTLALVIGARWPEQARKAVVGAVLIFGAVGMSRVTLGVHSPTDVFGGWALGVAVALATIYAAHLVLPRPRDGAPPENEKSPAVAELLSELSAGHGGTFSPVAHAGALPLSRTFGPNRHGRPPLTWAATRANTARHAAHPRHPNRRGPPHEPIRLATRPTPRRRVGFRPWPLPRCAPAR